VTTDALCGGQSVRVEMHCSAFCCLATARLTLSVSPVYTYPRCRRGRQYGRCCKQEISSLFLCLFVNEYGRSREL
jgi:hypothetical protein